jgi:triacylglycerol lipase
MTDAIDSSKPNNLCTTRWPILLVHGIASKRVERLKHWGRIPETLEAYGAEVYLSEQDAWGSFESNAWQLRTFVMQIINEQNVEKINVIAHSKGGIEARLLITLPDMADHIASITTISTPHHGVRALDWLYYLPVTLKRVVSSPIDIICILAGDDNPSFVGAFEGLSAKAMQGFNQTYPLPESVTIHSYTAVQRRLYNDPFLTITSPIVQLVEGDNDGLVSEASASFGEFEGVVNEEGRWGLSHRNIIDHSIPGMLPEEIKRYIGMSRFKRNRNRDNFNVLAWWVELVAGLQQKGY